MGKKQKGIFERISEIRANAKKFADSVRMESAIIESDGPVILEPIKPNGNQERVIKNVVAKPEKKRGRPKKGSKPTEEFLPSEKPIADVEVQFGRLLSTKSEEEADAIRQRVNESDDPKKEMETIVRNFKDKSMNRDLATGKLASVKAFEFDARYEARNFRALYRK